MVGLAAWISIHSSIRIVCDNRGKQMPNLLKIVLWLSGTAGVMILSLRFGDYKGWSTLIAWALSAAYLFALLWLSPSVISQPQLVWLLWILVGVIAVDRYVVRK